MNMKRLGIVAYVVFGAIGVVGAGITAAQADGSRLLALASGKHDTGNTVVLSADTACTPESAYRMWATSEGARGFFAPDARIAGTLGGEYTVMFFPADDPKGEVHGTLGARVLAMDPGHFLAFEWIVFAGDDKKGNNAPPYAPEDVRRPGPLPTWVELTFTPNAGGTHVEFRHYGFRDTPLWKQSQAWFTRAWGGVLAQMKARCEKQS